MGTNRIEKRHIAATVDNGRRRRGNNEKARGQQGIAIRRRDQHGQQSGESKRFRQQTGRTQRRDETDTLFLQPNRQQIYRGDVTKQSLPAYPHDGQKPGQNKPRLTEVTRQEPNGIGRHSGCRLFRDRIVDA